MSNLREFDATTNNFRQTLFTINSKKHQTRIYNINFLALMLRKKIIKLEENSQIHLIKFTSV